MDSGWNWAGYDYKYEVGMVPRLNESVGFQTALVLELDPSDFSCT